MLQTKKISKDLCAVAFAADEIMVRKSGKQYYGQEEILACIKDNKLIINQDVATKFGIEIILDAAQMGTQKQEIPGFIHEI